MILFRIGFGCAYCNDSNRNNANGNLNKEEKESKEKECTESKINT